MAVKAAFPNSFSMDQPTNSWQLSSFSGFMDIPENNFLNIPMFEMGKIDSDSSAPELMKAMVPQYIQPHVTYKSSSPTESAESMHSRQTSLESLSSFVPLDRQQALHRLSLASTDLNNDTYRPRKTPVRRRKGTTSRITPRSTKHARELELNRKAATKCRNRQKSFVQNLQNKCRIEEVRMHEQSALVHALHDEVVLLRNEVMRQSFCGCQSLRSNMPPLAS